MFVTKKLRIISTIAKTKDKIAAFIETGSMFISDSTPWTHQLYRAVDDDSVQIAYIMVCTTRVMDNIVYLLLEAISKMVFMQKAAVNVMLGIKVI